MVKILVVDNGGQWTHREWRTLNYLDVDTKIIPNTTPFIEIINENVNGLILSGGAPRVAFYDNLGNIDEYLKKANFPILGICAGHQYMAKFYGGEIKPAVNPEYGKVELIILKEDDIIFQGVPKKSIVWESHNDEISKMPNVFELLAFSQSCMIQAIKHKEKTFYGVQFHPEVEHTEFGMEIFKNFIKICKEFN
jgi:GMP synthase (glutamine-hydrolysing)